MFNTKNLVHEIKDVPIPWIFEHFCKLKERLEGQDVKIRSLFKEEKTPSMCIYPDKNKVYKFKDFSSGQAGSAVDLVKSLLNTTYGQASKHIVEQYNDFILHNNGGYDLQQFKQYTKYKVSQYVTRTWTTQDQYYWTQFNIGSKLLEEHCVQAMAQYTLEKEEEGEKKTLRIAGNYLYGFFTKEGILYKIYQPKTLDKKFIKVKDYIQGSEQLKDHDFLIITSSLKDLMALKSFKLSMDIVAPDSENTMIKRETMLKYIEKYKKVVVLFDYDEAGIKAMSKYKELYPEVITAVLPMSKDIADSIKDHTAKKVYPILVTLLNKKLNE